MLADGRLNNSRGGTGIGSTQYDEFWEACRAVLLPDSAADERRNSDTVYASRAHSIPNLVKLATDILQQKVDAKELDQLPAIPSVQWVRLQFVPNRADSVVAEQWTGRLQAKRAVQMRTLRKEHMDQHFVNAMTRYYLEWLVELGLGYDGVEFFGQDDKAKIPCGDAIPISSGVRANNKGIVAIGDTQGLKAMDHDFHDANLIASVTLRSNIPSSISGSFFIGDEESGNGQIFVTLRDATFDPSEVFDHCAQLIDTIRRKGLNPTVLVLQTDGGPDHSLKRVATKLALIAVFKELDIDHLVILRCAPNGSARNKAERSMSVLNLPLAHTSLMRADMPEWAELKVKSCSSMNGVREIGKKIKERRLNALADVGQLQEKVKSIVIGNLSKLLSYFCIRMYIYYNVGYISYSSYYITVDRLLAKMWEQNDLPAEQVASATLTTTHLVLQYLYTSIIEKPGSSDGAASDVAGAMVNVDGVSIVRDSSLASCVAKAKLDKAVEISSQDFHQEWKKSIGAPIKAISERFADLTTSGRPVLVFPRVPEEDVTALHDRLTQIDPNYTSLIMTAEHLKKVPKLVDYIACHAVTTPYSFSLQKCNNNECCADLRTPLEFVGLAMQRQPTPRADPTRPGHFLRREQSLAEASNHPNALTDLSDMPSSVGNEKKEAAKKKKARDIQKSKDNKLKSWDGRRVRAFVTCFHCNKRRCIYTGVDEDYQAAMVVLQQKLESIAGLFSCGDLLFDDSHYLSNILVQKQSLTCESNIEKGYYHNKDRSLKLEDVCIHCGEMGTESFLLRMPQLRQKRMTKGYDCFPICTACIGMGKDVVKGTKKDAIQARNERIANANAASNGN